MTYEVNMDESYKDVIGGDEWGMAFVWTDDGKKGAEYNYCIQEDGTNCCAIYFMEEDDEGNMITDHDDFDHYEIDFSRRDWGQRLIDAMMIFVLERI